MIRKFIVNFNQVFFVNNVSYFQYRHTPCLRWFRFRYRIFCWAVWLLVGFAGVNRGSMIMRWIFRSGASFLEKRKHRWALGAWYCIWYAIHWNNLFLGVSRKNLMSCAFETVLAGLCSIKSLSSRTDTTWLWQRSRLKYLNTAVGILFCTLWQIQHLTELTWQLFTAPFTFLLDVISCWRKSFSIARFWAFGDFKDRIRAHWGLLFLHWQIFVSLDNCR